MLWCDLTITAVLFTLHLLAFLFHTVLGWVDHTYHLVRQALAARQPFFQDLHALTRDLLCESWDHLLDFMLQGLEIGVPPDASENFNMRIAGGCSMSLTEKRDLR